MTTINLLQKQILSHHRHKQNFFILLFVCALLSVGTACVFHTMPSKKTPVKKQTISKIKKPVQKIVTPKPKDKTVGYIEENGKHWTIMMKPNGSVYTVSEGDSRSP